MNKKNPNPSDSQFNKLSPEMLAAQKAEVARRRAATNSVKPAIDRINKQQEKGGAPPSRV